MIETINPYSQQPIALYSFLSNQALDEKLEIAHRVYREWKLKSITERGKYFERLAELLRNKKEDLAKLITSEMGKPIHESRSEIEKCAGACMYYAQESEKFLAEKIVNFDAAESGVMYQPLGVILAIMPWNFPFWQVIRCAAPAMMAGNTVVLKHAPNTMGCANVIELLFIEAGFPAGAFQNLIIDIPQVEQVIAHNGVQAVSLTGSERAGKSVAAIAGKYLKKCVLELGGSDPFIVLDDADLDLVTEGAIKARLLNCGQSCIAGKRFIMSKKILRSFVNILGFKLEKLVVGDPMKSITAIGPMARLDLKETLMRQVKDSVEAGAQIEYGQMSTDGNLFIKPMVLTKVVKGMSAYEEELFGPVFTVIEADSESEMLRIANDTPYGLGASVWTKNKEKAHYFVQHIEAGQVFVNDFVRSDVHLPFGGIKNSGYGRELALDGILEFVNVKTFYKK